MMKRLSHFMLAGFVLTAMAGPVLAQEASKVCLNLRDISSTDPSKDGTSIMFKMRNGVSWRNDLQGRCPDLWFNGFKWVIQSTDQVCESEETFRVLDSGQVCTLGKFSQMTPAP
jgi:hypothetical protein